MIGTMLSQHMSIFVCTLSAKELSRCSHFWASFHTLPIYVCSSRLQHSFSAAYPEILHLKS